MVRTLGNFLRIKNSNSLTSEQIKLFKVGDFKRGWVERYKYIELSEECWAKALNSLSKSKGKFNRLNKPSKKQKLYLMTNESGKCKIGISQNPRSRRTELQTGSGESIKIQAVWECGIETIAIEQYLHLVFNDRRVRGEWFDLGENPLSVVHSEIQKNPSWGCVKSKV